ncbi:MAG: hypothetical protein R3C05_04810 [Pirellulaceae bacterium]
MHWFTDRVFGTAQLTGRQLCSDKQDSIPVHLAPIQLTLVWTPSSWCDVVQKFKIFKRPAGTAESLSLGQAFVAAKSIYKLLQIR